ncbi:MAG: tetratricopeptide repeat protein [Segetibacter sp.]
MKYIVLSAILLSTFYSVSLLAQHAEIDKNKIADYFQNEQYNEAIKYLDSSTANYPNDIYLLNSLGYAYYMNKDFQKAQGYYLKAFKTDTANFTANKYLASINTKYKQYDEAIGHYKRLVKTLPGNGMLYKYMGDVYAEKGNADSALIMYSVAYSFQPLQEKIISGYANQLLEGKNYKRTDSVLNAFLLYDSANVSAMMLAVRSAYEQENYRQAASFSNRWRNVDFVDINTTVHLAISNYNLKNYVLSFQLCDTLLQQGIDAESLLYYASRAMYKLNKFKKSNELLTQCLSKAITANADTYLSSKADNFEALKQYKKAISAYDTAYYLFKNPLSLYNIGRLYESGLNNKTLSYKYYSKYLRSGKPKSEDEKRVYAYVKELMEEKGEMSFFLHYTKKGLPCLKHIFFLQD